MASHPHRQTCCLLSERHLLCGSGLVASSQVIDVDDESRFVLTDHVSHFALVDALVLLHSSIAITIYL